MTEATKLGMILSLVVTNDVRQNIGSVDSVVGQLATIHRNNEGKDREAFRTLVESLVQMTTNFLDIGRVTEID